MFEPNNQSVLILTRQGTTATGRIDFFQFHPSFIDSHWGKVFLENGIEFLILSMSNFHRFFTYLNAPKIYYPLLATLTGGVTPSIFLWQILQGQNQLNSEEEWVKKTTAEITEETGLTLAEQLFARDQLKQRSLLIEKETSPEDKFLLMRINFEKLEQLLDPQFPPSSPTESPVKSSLLSVKTDPFFPPQRQSHARRITPHYKFNGPWQSEVQFEEFQRALLAYAKQQGIENPSGWVFRIIDAITKGIVSPFWDEFLKKIPLGSSQKIKRDWEIEPGIPYPAFAEERIQYYIQKGEPLEVATAKTRADLRNPQLGKDLWEGFLRKCDRIADQALIAKNQGVQIPYLPPSFSEKPEITKESVMEKLAAINPQKNLLSSPSQPPQSPHSNRQSLSEIPLLSSLNQAYQTPLGRSLVEQQLTDHPEWGYEIVNGEVVAKRPF